MRILVVTRSYPAPTDLYRYPFVHRRVLAYARAGHEVAVFRPTDGEGPSSHQFEDVTCHSGDAEALGRLVDAWHPSVLAVHGLSEQLWPALEPLARSLPIRAWLHGSEIPGILRAKARCDGEGDSAATMAAVRERCAFWDALVARKPRRLKLVFVSHSAAALARQDLALGDEDFDVIPNPIDTDLFGYRPKRADDRFNILTIRPFDSRGYGNDLAVAAILHLSGRDDFDRLRFTIVGEGPLFEETLRPLRHLANIDIQRGFLTQAEIAGQHRRNGIFLVPTRIDTQGVSRDEAMSSGLVPVTNSVFAVPEFVDERCAVLAAGEDAIGLADGISALVAEPGRFLGMSAAAAARVRRQSGQERIIPVELALLRAAAEG